MPDTKPSSLNLYRLATEDDDAVLRARKTSENLGRLANEELKERRDAGESTEATLYKQFAEGVARPAVSAGLRVLQGLGVDTRKMDDLNLPFPTDPDEYNRLDAAKQQAVNQSGIYPEGFTGDLAKGAMSAAQQVPTMIGTGMVGSLLAGPAGAYAGMVGTFSAQAWNDAYTEAIDQGLGDDRAREYANLAAGTEAVVTTAFQAVGLGGIEKQIARGLSGAARKKFTQSILQKAASSSKTFAKGLSQEELEEITIESVNNFSRASEGVDPTATDMDNMIETAVDTAIQTFWMQVFVSGGGSAGKSLEKMSARVLQIPKGEKGEKGDAQDQVPPELEQAQADLFPEGTPPTDGSPDAGDGTVVPDDGSGVIPNLSTAEAIEAEYEKRLLELELVGREQIADSEDPDAIRSDIEHLREGLEQWRQEQLDGLTGADAGVEDGSAGVAPDPTGATPTPTVPGPAAPDAEGMPSQDDLAGTINEEIGEPVPSQDEVSDKYGSVENVELLRGELQEAVDAEATAREELGKDLTPDKEEMWSAVLQDSVRTIEAIKARLLELGEGSPEDSMTELEQLAQELQVAADEIESVESPVDGQADEVGLERLTWDARRLTDGGELVDKIGQSNSVSLGGSPVVQMDVNGVKVPFIQPKDSVENPDIDPGKWYPFFGLTDKGVAVEGNSTQVNDYYGVQELRGAAETLDEKVGDIREFRSPAVKPTGVLADELNDGLGLSEARPSTDDEKHNQVKELLERISGQRPVEETQEPATDGEVVTPEAAEAAEPQVKETEGQKEPEVRSPAGAEAASSEPKAPSETTERSPEDIIDSYTTKAGFASEEAKAEGRQQAVQAFVNDGTLPDRQSKYDDSFPAEERAEELTGGTFADNRTQIMEDFARDGSLPEHDNLQQEELRGALQEISQDDELRGALQVIADRIDWSEAKPEEKKTLGEKPADQEAVESVPELESEPSADQAPSEDDLAAAIDSAFDEEAEVEKPSEEQLQEDENFERVDAELSEQDRQIKDSLQEASQYRVFGPSYRGDINVRAERLQTAFDEQALPEQKKILHDELREFLDRESAKKEIGKKTLGEKSPTDDSGNTEDKSTPLDQIRRKMDIMVREGVITREDADLFIVVVEQMDEEGQERANVRYGRYITNNSRKKGVTETWRDESTNEKADRDRDAIYINPTRRDNADFPIPDSFVLLHELAHVMISYANADDPSASQEDKDAYAEILKLLTELGSSSKFPVATRASVANKILLQHFRIIYGPGMSDYLASSPEESVAQLFAESVMRRRVPSDFKSTSLPEALARLKDWIKSFLEKLSTSKQLEAGQRKRIDELLDVLGHFKPEASTQEATKPEDPPPSDEDATKPEDPPLDFSYEDAADDMVDEPAESMVDDIRSAVKRIADEQKDAKGKLLTDARKRAIGGKYVKALESETSIDELKAINPEIHKDSLAVIERALNHAENIELLKGDIRELLELRMPAADKSRFEENRDSRVSYAKSAWLAVSVEREYKENPENNKPDYQRRVVKEGEKKGITVLLSDEQKEDSSAVQTEKHGKADVFPGLNIFISENTDVTGEAIDTSRRVTHIPTGLEAAELSRGEAYRLVHMLSVLGIKVDAEVSKISNDAKAVIYAFESGHQDDVYGYLKEKAKEGKFTLMEEVDRLAQPVPDRSPADLNLGRAELDYDSPATSEAQRGKRVIGELIAGDSKVPEFGFNPVFVVTSDLKLRYQNGFTFTLNPEIFLVGKDELKEGMLVSINLTDIGKKYKTARQVVSEYLVKWGNDNTAYEISQKKPNKTSNVYGVQVSLAEEKRSREERIRRRAETKEAGLPAGLVSIDADNVKVSEINLSRTKGFKYELMMNGPRYSLEDGSEVRQFKTVKEVKEALADAVDNESVTVEIREDQLERTMAGVTVPSIKVSDENRWSFTSDLIEGTELGNSIAKVLNGINWTQPKQKEGEERLAKEKSEEEKVAKERSSEGIVMPGTMSQLREQLAEMSNDEERRQHIVKLVVSASKTAGGFKEFTATVRSWGINVKTDYRVSTVVDKIFNRVKELSSRLPAIRSALEYLSKNATILQKMQGIDFGSHTEVQMKTRDEAANRLMSAAPNISGVTVAGLTAGGQPEMAREWLTGTLENTFTKQEVDSLFEGNEAEGRSYSDKTSSDGKAKAKAKKKARVFSDSESISDEIARRTISFDQAALDQDGQTFIDLESEKGESLREGLVHESNQAIVARERKEKRDQLRKDILDSLAEPVTKDLQSLGKVNPWMQDSVGRPATGEFSLDKKSAFADALSTALAGITYGDVLQFIKNAEEMTRDKGDDDTDLDEYNTSPKAKRERDAWFSKAMVDSFTRGDTEVFEDQNFPLMGPNEFGVNLIRSLLKSILGDPFTYSKLDSPSRFPETAKIIRLHLDEAASIATNLRKQEKTRGKRKLKAKAQSVKDLIQDTEAQNEALAEQFKQLMKRSLFGVGVHADAQIIAAKLAAGILKEYSLKGIDKLMTFSQYVARAAELLGPVATLKMSKYLERAWDTAKAVVEAGEEMEGSRSIKMVLDGPIRPELDFAEEAEVGYGVTDYTNAESPDSYAVSGNQRDATDIKERAKHGRATGVSVLSVKKSTRKDKTTESKVVLPLLTVRKALIEHVNIHGLPVFIDSGMFGIVQQGEVGQEPDFGEVMKYYLEFLSEIDADKTHLVTVVAPDFLTKIETPEGEKVIGDAVKTQELQEKYKDEILFLIGSKENADGELVGFGANVIIPVQRKFNKDGNPDTSYTFDQGSPFGDLDFPFSPRIILGVPYNAARWTNEEIAKGAKVLEKSVDWGKDRLRLHLLGGGITRGKELAKLLHKINPTIELMGDSTTEANKVNAGKYREEDGLSVETIDLDKSEFDNVQDAITDGLVEGKNMANASKLREAISDFLGEPNPRANEASRIKEYDGIIERAVAAAAAAIMERQFLESLDDQKVYDDLVDLYRRSPTQAKTRETQQGAMPAPLAFLVQKELNLGSRDVPNQRHHSVVVYDPIARSGMLVAGLEWPSSFVVLNDPREDRAEGLIEEGHVVTNEDPATHTPSQRYHSVVVNATGKGGRDAVGKALSGMPDNGNAVIILDGAADSSLSSRKKAVFYREDSEFFDRLYDLYAVTGHYVLSGSLFENTGKDTARQVIVIEGRHTGEQETSEGDAKESLKRPYSKTSGVVTKDYINSWEELGHERLGLQREAASDDGGADSNTATGEGQDSKAGRSAGTTQGQDGLDSGQQSNISGSVRGGVGQQDGTVSDDDAATGRPSGDGGVSGDSRSGDRGADVSDSSAGGGERGSGISGDTTSDSEVAGGRDDSVEAPSPEDLADLIAGVLDEVEESISGEPSPDQMDNFGSDILSEADQVPAPDDSPASGGEKPPKPKDTTGVRPPKDEKPPQANPDLPSGGKTREQLEREMEDLFDDFKGELGGSSLGMSGGNLTGLATQIVLKAIELKIFDFKEAVRKWASFAAEDKLVAMGAYIEKAWDAIHRVYGEKHYPQMTPSRDIRQVLDEINREGATESEEKPKESKPKKVEFDDTTEFQVPYVAKSSNDVPSIGTLVPRNQQAAVQENLDAVEAKHGNLVDFVATELGYRPETLRKEDKNGETIFSAEQIDAIALAIASHKDGYAFVNGDMTGVGKGRFAAAMIIYAIKQGKRPVFVTEKVDLFSDIMRDLTDILQNEAEDAFEPWITTAVTGENAVDLHSAVEHRYRKRLDKDTAARHAGGRRQLKHFFPEGQESSPQIESEVTPGETLGRDSKGYFVTEDRIHKQTGDNAEKIAVALLESMRAGNGMTVSSKQRKKMGMRGQEVTYDAIFTTYTQMQTVRGKESWRHAFFRELSEKAFFIMDESHTAAGKQDGPSEADEGKLLRSDFAIELLGIAAENGANAVFASATFSKTPATMALYALTGISEGMKEGEELLEILRRGGVPLQQALSEMMAESGRYIRRERSFAGIEFSHPQIPVDVKQMNEVSAALQQMNKLNAAAKRGLRTAVENKILTRTELQTLGRLQNVSGILWNIVNQVLFASKARGVAKLALEAIERGEKPFIAINHTGGAALLKHLDDFPPGERPEFGEVLNYDIRSLFRTYLDRCITMVNKVDPNDESTWIVTQLTEKHIGGAAMQAYEDIKVMIDRIPAGLSASPIDVVRHELERKGKKIREITGRKVVLEHQANGSTTLEQRPEEERGSKGKQASVKAYNDGEVDCLIGNVSAAVGLSAHASKKFKNTDRRVMFVVMPIPEINGFMQMLGRINRTGQLEEKEGEPKGSNLPRFFMTVSQSPTEQRIASSQARKLASLNANVTASDETDVKSDAPDVFNAIGNRIMAQYCIDEAKEAEEKFGNIASSICSLCEVAIPESAATAPPAFMHKITGRLILLPFDRQKAFWKHVDAEFGSVLETLNQMDSNPLKAAFKDFNAKVLKTWDIFEGDEGGTAFQKPAQLQEMQVEKRLSLMTSKEIRAEIDRGYKGEDPEAVRAAERKGLIEDVAAEAGTMIEKINESDELSPSRKTKLTKEMLERTRMIRLVVNLVTPGTVVTLKPQREDARFKSMTGIVLRMNRKRSSQDPTKFSDFSLVIAVDNELKRVTIPFSQMQDESSAQIKVSTHRRGLNEVLQHFEDESVPTTEVRYMGTGNLLAAFEELEKGSIVFFSTDDGQVKRGVLMPRDFTPEKWERGKPTVFGTAEDLIRFVMDLKGTVRSVDQFMRIETVNGNLSIRVTPRTTTEKYYKGEKAEALEKAANAKWSKNKGAMELIVTGPKSTEVGKVAADSRHRLVAVAKSILEMTKVQTAFQKDRDIARANNFASRGGSYSSRSEPTREFSELGNDTQPKSLGSKSSGGSRNVRGEMDDSPRNTSGKGSAAGRAIAKFADLANMVLKDGELVSAQAFRNMLGRLFDTDIGTGNAAGLRPGSGIQGLWVIREQFVKMSSKNAFDIGVLMHETAHDIDGKLGLMATLPPDVELAMVGFDYDSNERRNFEGFAEFIRMYVTLHKAPDKTQADYPRMTGVAYKVLVKWFENDFAEMHPDTFERIVFAQTVAHRFMEQSPLQAAHVQIVTNVQDYLDEYQAEQEKRFGMRRMKFKTMWLDAFAAIKRLQDEVERRAGSVAGVGPYADRLSALEYMSATARSSVSNAERAIHTGVWRMDDEPGMYNEELSEGIMEGLNDFTTHEYNEFGSYLHARITLFDKNHQTALLVGDAHAIVEHIREDKDKLAKYDKMRDTLQKFNNALIEMAMHAGVYSQKEFEDMKNAYGVEGSEYVPLIRVKVGKRAWGKNKSMQTVLAKGGGHLQIPRSVYHKTKEGSMDPIVHPVMATLQRAERLYDEANQAQALKHLIWDSNAVGGLGFLIKKVPAGTVKLEVRLEEILKKLVDINVIDKWRMKAILTAQRIRLGAMDPDSDESAKDVQQMLDNYGVGTWQDAIAQIPSTEYYIDYYRSTWPRSPEGEQFLKVVEEDGEVSYYQVHDLIAVGLRHMSSLNRHPWAQAVNVLTRLLKAGATGLSTGFGMRQVWMDSGTVAIQGRDVKKRRGVEMVLPIGTMKQLVRQAAAGLGIAAEDEMIKIYKQNGGALIHALNVDERSMRNYLQSPLKRSLGSKVAGAAKGSIVHPLREGFPNMVESVSKLTDLVAAAVSWTDVAPRMLEFEAVLNNHGYSLKNGQIIYTESGALTMPPRHILMRAVNGALNSTYNYRRIGTLVVQLEPFIPFLNAAIQSSVKTGKTTGELALPKMFQTWLTRIISGERGNMFASEEPTSAQHGRLPEGQYSQLGHRTRVAYAVGLAATSLTLMSLADAMRDDDDDEEEAKHTKGRGLSLGYKGKEILHLPWPRDYAIGLGISEVVADKLYWKPEKKTEEIVEDIKMQMREDANMRAPALLSGVTGMISGLMKNEDPFFGSPIDSYRDRDKPNYLRATRRSSVPGKFLSEGSAAISQSLLGPQAEGLMSPNQFDFAIDEISGGLGRTLTQTIWDDAARAKELHADGTLLNTVEGWSFSLSAVPFMKGIFKDRIPQKSIGEIYDVKREYDNLHDADKESKAGFVIKGESKWREMTHEEKSYRYFNAEYIEMMGHITRASKDRGLTFKDRDMALRMRIGLARAGLGKDPLESYQSPYDLPKSEWPEFLTRRRSGGTAAKPRSVYEEMQVMMRGQRNTASGDGRATSSLAERTTAAKRWVAAHEGSEAMKKLGPVNKNPRPGGMTTDWTNAFPK